VSANAAGQIDKWAISLTGGGFDPAFLARFTGFGLFECPNPHFCTPILDEDTVFNSTNETQASNQDHPGTWSISTTGATVPEPATRTFLLIGLANLMGLALKKSL
jgi:hypothetical protein